MKILLVDDEDLVLEGLEMLIKDMFPGFEIYSANDGNAALKLVYEHAADIIVTDVRMPGMDGLSFCEKLQEHSREARIIIISGYEDFHYAKRAIDLGVSNYMLKPIDQEYFADIFKKLVADIEDERKNLLISGSNLQMAKKKLVAEMVQYDMSEAVIGERLRQTGLSLFRSCYLLALMEIDQYYLVSDYRDSEEFYQLYREMERIISGNTRFENADVVYTENKPGSFTFFVTFDGEWEDSCFYGICREINASLNISVTVGIGGIHRSAGEIYAACQEARIAAGKSFFGGQGEVYRYERDDGGDRPGPGANIVPPVKYGVLDRFEESLSEALKRKDYDLCRNIIALLFKEFESKTYPPENMNALCLKLYVSMLEHLREAGGGARNEGDVKMPRFQEFTECKTLDDLKNFISESLACVTQYSSKSDRSQANLIAGRVIQLIREDYINITLQSAARKVNISPIYLSILFKEKTGENFKDFVLKERAAAAKKFLQDPTLKIYEIAEKTGYNDAKHFSKMFSRLTGFTPTEYREQIAKDLQRRST